VVSSACFAWDDDGAGGEACEFFSDGDWDSWERSVVAEEGRDPGSGKGGELEQDGLGSKHAVACSSVASKRAVACVSVTREHAIACNSGGRTQALSGREEGGAGRAREYGGQQA
jgi:hypothetical protein